MPRPNFLVIGAAKSGTSSLHDYLGQHPDVFVSRVKEPNYLAFAGGLPGYRGPDDDPTWGRVSAPRARLDGAKYRHSVRRPRRYEALFDGVRGERAVGESSVATMFFPETAERIERWLPGARLVVQLRQPAERAFSGFVQLRADGIEPLADFAAAIAADRERSRRNWSPPWRYVQRGFYHAQLRPFFERFGRERICVQLYDAFVPDTSRRLMAATAIVDRPRSLRFARLLDLPNPLKSAFNVLVPDPRRGQPLRRLLLHANRAGRVKPRLDPAVHAELTEHYRSDILALQELVGRDLGAWLA